MTMNSAGPTPDLLTLADRIGLVDELDNAARGAAALADTLHALCTTGSVIKVDTVDWLGDRVADLGRTLLAIFASIDGSQGDAPPSPVTDNGRQDHRRAAP